MTQEASFADYCQDVIIPWLNRYVEIEKIHLNSLKTKLRNAQDYNSSWISFFSKQDTQFIQECIDHSEIVIKGARKQIKQYNDYIQKHKAS